MRPRARSGMALMLALVVSSVGLGAQMPDPRLMSGIPMPSGDVPPGSVSVRLVRGELTNNITGHPVELRSGERVQTGRTDAEGRAVFSGLPPGAPIQAAAVVDGERIESQSFALPPDAGVRLVLVAGLGIGSPAGASGAAPAPASAPGEVVLGGDSRIQIEFDDDTLEVFYLFDVVNGSPVPVNPAHEIVFELPDGAEQAAMLEGSSTQASVRGRVVSISGPFAPGVTPVQLAFTLGPGGAARTVVQKLPVTWSRVQVIMTRAGAAAMSSPQFTTASDMPGQGQSFVLGVGGPIAAGQELSLSLTGLPSRSSWGRVAAISVALLVLAWGVYAAATARGTGDDARHAQLVERRDKLMADLVRIEQQLRSGTLDPARHRARRDDLMAQLERVYGELDEQPVPAGAGQGQRA